MISVEGLVKSYGSLRAVDGVSFEVGTGEVVAFLGPNGAGKTTTLRVLSTYLPPTEGRVRIGGLDVLQAPLEIRRLVGYLPENNPLYEDMEVSEYLDWTAEVRGFRAGDRATRVRRAVEQCGLGPMLGKDLGLLSKGYRQRVGLAQAILHDPPVLLLDEPTSGLDPNQARDVRALLAELKTRKTVFVSTHILPEAEALADRVVIIHRGRIAAQGRPGDLTGALRGTAGTTTFATLKLAGKDESKAVTELERIAGVSEVARAESPEGLRVRIVSEADPREAVFRCAVKNGWTLIELGRQSADLEDVFHELTGV